MKHFSGLIFFAIMGYLIWPYFHLYQLNNAIEKRDRAAFEELIDFDAVNKVYQENLKWKSEHIIEPQGGSLLPESMREKAQEIASAIGNFAAETMELDTNRIQEILRNNKGTVWKQTSFAFFESPTRFTIRIGKLGRDPVHVQMTLQDWYWRVTAIYD